MDEKKTVNGINIYPIYMREYEQYAQAKQYWAQRQTFLPVKYLFKPFVVAMFDYCISREQAITKDAPKECFFGLLKMLILALRLDVSLDDMFKKHVILRFENGNMTFDKIVFEQDGEEKSINASTFDIIRTVVAEQNGIELPNESDNVEILRAYEEKKEYYREHSKARKLKISTEDLIETVAYLSNLRYDEILTWRVKEFERRERAIQRVEEYRAYANAELCGFTSFKKGNPCPSLFFDTVDEDLGTISLGDANLSGAANEINAANEAAQTQTT